MPDVRPISISPFDGGVSARRATIMSKKLRCDHLAIHKVKNDEYGRHRYHPCASPLDFLQRYKKYVLKQDVNLPPRIEVNTDGDYILKL